MRVTAGGIPGVLVVDHTVHRDQRGWFVESWVRAHMAEAGIGPDFVQDNLVYSTRGVLRGLHLQLEHPQGKLVAALTGEIFDVAVDLRLGSPTFGRWAGVTLRAHERCAVWIPPGFAHGYYVCSDEALVSYKVTDVWHPESERVLAWDDPDVGVAWPIPAGERPVLSARDEVGLGLGAIYRATN